MSLSSASQTVTAADCHRLTLCHRCAFHTGIRFRRCTARDVCRQQAYQRGNLPFRRQWFQHFHRPTCVHSVRPLFISRYAPRRSRKLLLLSGTCTLRTTTSLARQAHRSGLSRSQLMEQAGEETSPRAYRNAACIHSRRRVVAIAAGDTWDQCPRAMMGLRCTYQMPAATTPGPC